MFGFCLGLDSEFVINFSLGFFFKKQGSRNKRKLVEEEEKEVKRRVNKVGFVFDKVVLFM